MNRRRLCKDLGESESKVRLIAVTGYGRAEDVQRSREAGFHDHLVKPITSNKLAQFLVPN